ncbi:helix-turn-helix domain protein [Clostridium saccharobutylicum]|nr:hypothetical protein [Clostridium saccharobutylicum]OAV38848.1 hypothetical protein M945_3718 [Clostridium saccharobutylicum DSM 13864]AQR89471.1 helix-turn-helix domain protein [Clostridium saccharobutylicum]AQR99373.1 helix-turn-helix domain protein [Clostridium saccharobutylicum]AQS09104.1 helix-turn-helix domain protein [Clostridium saccharobutylicum]AQS13359.1 helix-turn-helix domain protein [Clostridium saccharobutylicum]
MTEKEIIEELKEQWKEEVKLELLAGLKNLKSIKVLGRAELMKLFNCDRFKMNEIMSSEDKPPVVYIGRDYYITEQQMIEYFEGEENKKRRKNKVSKTQVMGNEFYSDLRVLYKKDLMKMFNMGRTKFLEFIKTETIPVKVIGQECYITEKKLQEWFYNVADTRIVLSK